MYRFADTNRIKYNPKARKGELSKTRKVNVQSSDSELEQSEKSYPPLITAEEFLEKIIELNYNLSWTFFAIMGNLLLYIFITYQIVFDRSIRTNFAVIFIKIGANMVLMLDLWAIIVHHWRKDVQIRVAYSTLNLRWFSIYLLSMSSMFFEIAIHFYQNILIEMAIIFLVCLRFWKIGIYIALMNNLPGHITLVNLYKQYLLIWAFIVHTFVCIWMLIGCVDKPGACDHKYHGPMTYWNSVVYHRRYIVYDIGMDQLSPFEIYCICLTYVLGGLTSLGFGGASRNNGVEEVICIIFMFFYVWLVYGLLNANFTVCIIHAKSFENQMIFRLQSMESDLQKLHYVPLDIRRRIILHYKEFILRDKAVKHATLMHVIPDPFVNETKTEIFWNGLMKCKIFRNTSEAFQKAIMRQMKSEAYSRGDILFDVGKVAGHMCFVARGNVYILSGEDADSPIVTLGKGTLIGIMNLLYSKVTKFKIVVATYSIIYTLNKRDFWLTVRRYNKLEENQRIHASFQKRIIVAEHMRSLTQRKPAHSFVRKWKCLESKKILSEFKERIKKEAAEIDVTKREKTTLKELYIYSEIHNQKSYDDIFLTTKYPWILQPNSQFLFIWDRCVLMVVAFVCLYYPYMAAFYHTGSLNVSVTTHAIFAVYAVDILIQIHTAIETKTDVIWHVADILWARMENVPFILDIFATIPFYFIPLMFDMSLHMHRIFSVICLNRIFKMYKINEYIRLFEETTNLYLEIVKAMKYALYVCYLGYIAGSIYYMISCFESPECYPGSWVREIQRARENLSNYIKQLHSPFKFIFTLSFQTVLTVVTNTCPSVAVTIEEHMVQSTISVIGLLVINYLFVEYAAGFTMKYSSAIDYLEFYNATTYFMAAAKMPKQLVVRVINQLETNWSTNRGLSRELLYVDCPQRLFDGLQIAINIESLVLQPLFQDLDEHILHMISTKCVELTLAPGEFVVYSGEIAKNTYIIVKGFCTIIEGNVGKKVLGPNSFINGLETYLGLPTKMTIRATTYVKCIMLHSKDLKFIGVKYPEFDQTFRNAVDEEATSRLFKRVSDFYATHLEDYEEKEQSFFIFPKYRRHPLNIDYKTVYSNSNWKIIRYVLLRRTIMPNGRFIKNWEIFKAITAFLLAFLTPTDRIFTHYFEAGVYFIYFIYCICFFDMYLRMHVCYYNEKGILVTHPMYTAKYYISHAFLLDFFGAIPISFILRRFANIQSSKIVGLLNCNVLLQMYRFPEAFSYIRRSIYRKNNVLYQAARCIPFTLVLINLCTCILMYISSEAVVTGGEMDMRPYNYSWISSAPNLGHLNITEPYIFHFLSFYFTTCLMFTINFDQFHSHTREESIFILCCVVFGYLFKTYIMVSIAHSRYVVNQKLIIHRNDMVQLLDYLKEENISKALHTQVIEHYVQSWRITHGFKPRAMFSLLHLPLRTDFCLHIYLETLQKVPIFEYAGRNFFRHLGPNLHELYLKKNQQVVKLNDVVRTVYIVHKGEVRISGPTGNVFCELRQGSVFGNIDEVSCIRSMITAKTTMTTDLLLIKTDEFYNLLFPRYKFVYKRLQYHILLQNLSYVQSNEKSAESDHDFTSDVKLSRLNKVISSSYYAFVVIVSALSSCMLSSYNMAFKHIPSLTYVLYFLDGVHITQVILNFYVPYDDKRGDLVTDLKLIRKRYMQPMKFYLDSLTIFPFELFSFFLSSDKQGHYRRCLSLYRILRAVNVYQYFPGLSSLSNKTVWVRLLLNLTYTVVIVHLGACLFYFTTCPFGKCGNFGWVYDREKYVCGDEYFCSIHIMMSIVSSTGFGLRVPQTIPDMAIFILVLIVSQYVLTLFLGDLTALIRSAVYNLTKYDFEVKEFLTHLENSFVSRPFLEKMKKYFFNLWLIGKGRQIPTLLLSSPNYLIEEIKMQAYGRHILNNVVFANCHIDFVRTLVRKMKVQKFFVGDTICHQEDINDTMYFIHKGIVDVYSVTETEEVHIDILQELDCFGIIQGLFPDTPHTHTFRSNAATTVLFLTYSEWKVLLKFFPASKFEIYKNLEIFN